MTSRELTKKICFALEEKKAEEVCVIQIDKISTIGDYFVIANGTNPNQVSALTDSVEEALGKEGYKPKRKEGLGNSGWVLLDYQDVIVHIFNKENRTFYDLERIWRDGVRLSPKEL